MAASSRQTDLVQKPTFVFIGTIKRLKSATMKEVPVSERTAIVTVDQIIEAPPDLAGYSKQDITVQLSGRKKVDVGQQMIFHATSWMYGSSIAVQSLSQEPAKGSHTSIITGADPVARRAQQHFDTADLVVSGKVVAVRLPTGLAPSRKRESAIGPISEHDPKWREAIIQVDQVHKGKQKKKQIVVRFPTSTDVMWHRAPKFQAGQEGYFVLQKAQESTSKGATKQKGKVLDAGAYQALDPGDFQPYRESGGIKTIIESESSKSKSRSRSA